MPTNHPIPNFLEVAKEAYRLAHRTPTLVSARIEEAKANVKITSTWSQVNLSSYKSAKFARDIVVEHERLEGGSDRKYGFPVPLDGIELSRQKNGLRVNIKSGTEKDEQFIDVWDHAGLRESLSLKDHDVHGKVCTDGEFGSLDVSADSSKLVYLAEKKVPKSLAFFYQGKVSEDQKEKPRGREYEYKQNWGEQLVGTVDPVIVVAELGKSSDALKVVEGVPDGWSPGLVKFWNSGLVGVAYKTTPLRLGKIYCSNRPAMLFHLDLASGKFTNLRDSSEKEEVGIVEFTVNAENGRLVWFERKLRMNGMYPGPHQSSEAVMALDSKDGTPYEILSAVQPNFDGTFSKCCGIFRPDVPDRCWINEDTLVISCPQGQTEVPILINCKDRTVKVLAAGSYNQGVTMLDVCSGYVLGRRSDPATPSHLVIAKFDAESGSLDFVPVVPPVPISHITWKSFLLHPSSFPDFNFGFGSIFVGNKNKMDNPLIVWPHGGPHSVISSSFLKTAHFFIEAGFSILFVNFRGSIGFGEEVVNALPERIGDMDVKDCVQAKDMCLKEFPEIPKDKIFLMGGSHGGFLVTHLAGQYPESWQGVVARNPVTDLTSMVGVTDIPDWVFNEAGLNYTGILEADDYKKLYEKSPISHIRNIQAPIFLMIGQTDLRVPPSQGINFYHTLKTLGKRTQMNMYDDNHPLGKPVHDANVMISTAIFFLKESSL